MARWVQLLTEHLTRDAVWPAQQIDDFAELVPEIQRDWTTVTGRKPTPKVHMLTHALQFVRRRGVLAQLSESTMESSHHVFNRLMTLSHSNLGEDLAERLRRRLADGCG